MQCKCQSRPPSLCLSNSDACSPSPHTLLPSLVVPPPPRTFLTTLPPSTASPAALLTLPALSLPRPPLTALHSRYSAPSAGTGTGGGDGVTSSSSPAPSVISSSSSSTSSGSSKQMASCNRRVRALARSRCSWFGTWMGSESLLGWQGGMGRVVSEFSRRRW